MHLAARELPDEPTVDGAEGKAVASVLAQQPLERRRREVRIGNETVALADQPGVELAAAFSGAPVLPDDRRRNRLARSADPEQRRLALVLYRDRVDGLEPGSARRGQDALPDLPGVVLDPARPREVLRQLRVP